MTRSRDRERDLHRRHRSLARVSSRRRSSGERSRRRYQSEYESPCRCSGTRREEKVKEHPKQRDGVDGSEDLYRRPYKQERVSENFFRMPERIHSSPRKVFASKPSHESEHLPNSRKSPREAQENRSKADIMQNRNHETVPREEEGEEEQQKIVECVFKLRRMGKKGLRSERTYSEPRKWMRGKGRVTIQFGCCYNYAVDRNGNRPGILRSEEVDRLPPLFKEIVKRMVSWNILPSTCIPNSCIVNIYEEGDCIPPHVDHHDFVRPFCSLSLLTECNIVFGSTLKVVGPGDFSGPVSIPLPVGSVLVLKDNGADIAKHCVPRVPSKRISIAFRKMDDSKLPYKFLPDPDLLGIKPLI
ncbi:RNA demethylase ALKBH5 [Morella rubra]|uniref:RNA demethylase ALKBH5 n=1 Tax=Morella rubra TaxID=262757 RepID=A0A6A1V2X6_9ROSI|nr:RNA demethylase ALKBH5 [Morella rubra]